MVDAADIISAGSTPITASNPLATFKGWQEYANSVATNKQIKAQTANTEQNTKNQAQHFDKTAYEMNASQIIEARNGLVELLSSNEPITKESITKTFQNNHENGLYSADMRDHMIAQVPDGLTPDQYRELVRAKVMTKLPSAIQAEKLLPRTGSDEDGQNRYGTQQQPAMGVPNPGQVTRTGPGVPVGRLTEAQLNEEITVPDGKGGVYKGPRRLAPGFNGSMTLDRSGPGGTIPVPGATGGTGGRMGDGSYPKPTATPAPSSTPAPVPAPTATPAPAAGTGNPLETGSITPANQAAQNEKDNALYNEHIKAAPEHKNQAENLTKVDDLLKVVDTGPGLESFADWRAKLVTAGRALGQDFSGISNQTEAYTVINKYLNDYARKSGNAGVSNAQLDASKESNISTHVDSRAARHVNIRNIGIERMESILPNIFPDKNGVGYSVWRGDQRLKINPEAFSADRLTSKELLEKVSHMSPEQKKIWSYSYNLARKHGALGDPVGD